MRRWVEDARVGRAWLALVRYTRHAPAALANAVAEGDDRVRGQAPIVPAEVVVACVAVVAWVRGSIVTWAAFEGRVLALTNVASF